MRIEKLFLKVIVFIATATLCLSFRSLGAEWDFNNEVLRYKIYWTFFHVANSESKISKIDNDKYLIVGKLSTSGVAKWFKSLEDKGYSVWNLKTLTPEKTYITQREGNYAVERIYIYDLEEGKVNYTKRYLKTGKEKVRVIDIPEIPFQDFITAIFYLRKFGKFVVDKETSFTFFDGKKFETLKFKVVKKEKISTPIGEVEAFKVIPSKNFSPEGSFQRTGRATFWFSTDERHIPLKVIADVKIGSVKAVIESIE
ncbi:MAG: DUF3108 domain-containing protein [Desulfurobacteriaceae bacterium]